MKIELIQGLLELLISQQKPTGEPLPDGSGPFKVGANYFIRTVTHHFTGKLVEVHDKELVLVDAAWIADDGRLSETIVSGNYSEIEPFPDGCPVVINRASLIDAIAINHALPRKQK